MCWLLHIFFIFWLFDIDINLFGQAKASLRLKVSSVWVLGLKLPGTSKHIIVQWPLESIHSGFQPRDIRVHLGHCEDSSPTGCPPDVFFIHFDHPACNKLSLLPKAPWKFGKVAGWKSSKKQWRHGRIGAKFCTLFGLRYADADNVLNPAFWLKASHWSRAFCISCEWNICFCRGFSHFNHLTFLKESMKINGIQPNSTDPANLRPAAVVVSHEAFPKLTT